MSACTYVHTFEYTFLLIVRVNGRTSHAKNLICLHVRTLYMYVCTVKYTFVLTLSTSRAHKLHRWHTSDGHVMPLSLYWPEEAAVHVHWGGKHLLPHKLLLYKVVRLWSTLWDSHVLIQFEHPSHAHCMSVLECIGYEHIETYALLVYMKKSHNVNMVAFCCNVVGLCEHLGVQRGKLYMEGNYGCCK